MAQETLADLIAADTPPGRHDPVWTRLRLSLANVDPLPPALAPAHTLVAFQIAIADREKRQFAGGFREIYTMARHKAQAPRLARDLADFGLPEAAELAEAARAQFSCKDEDLYHWATFHAAGEENPKMIELGRLSDAALGQDYEAAAWRALKAGQDAAAEIPAASGKRGFWGWLLSK